MARAFECILRRVLTAVVIASLAAILAASGTITANAQTRTSAQQVTEALACQCGCGLTVANCIHPNCSFGIPVRGEIDQMIRGGMSTTAIVASFRAKYGEKVLAAPTAEGFNLLAWTMPFVALLAGGAMIFFFIGRRRTDSTAKIAGDDPQREVRRVDAELRRRLEHDVKEQA
ncbi:MAG: cytochrome c-type biogenesis protein [Candidatus Binataceae bacterium]